MEISISVATSITLPQPPDNSDLGCNCDKVCIVDEAQAIANIIVDKRDSLEHHYSDQIFASSLGINDALMEAALRDR